MKLWDLQHHFQSWVFWFFETAKLHVWNPYFLQTIIIMNSVLKQSASFFRRSKLSLSPGHLMLDILVPATTFFLVLLPSDSPAVPQSKGSVREDAARCPAAGHPQERRTSVCPWARARGRGGCCWPTEDYSSYSCPMSLSNMTESQWHLSITHLSLTAAGWLRLRAWRGRTKTSCLKSSNGVEVLQLFVDEVIAAWSHI